MELQKKRFNLVIIDDFLTSYITVLDKIEDISAIKPMFKKYRLKKKVLFSDFFKRHLDFYVVIHFNALKVVG